MLTSNGSITDVAAELDTCPGYRIDQPVRLRLSGFHTRPQPNCAKDAAAICDCLSRGFARTGVKDLAGKSGSTFEPVDRIALADVVGVTGGRHYNTERGPGVPIGGDRVEPAGKR